MKLRKMLSLLAAAAMAVTALTVSITASAETVATGECGGSINWTLDSDGVLTLSGEGRMNDHKEDQLTTYKHWSYSEYADKIKEVVVEEGITQIGPSAFGAGMQESSCCYPNLTKVTLPSTLTEIGPNSFKYDSNLEEINIPDSLNFIGQTAFFSSGLKNIDFHSGIEIGGSAFHSCNSLKEVTVPKDLVYRLTQGNPPSANRMFYGCKSLERVVIEGGGEGNNYNEQLSNAFLPGGMFYGCTGLTTVIIMNSCEYISNEVFKDCKSLTDIYFYNTDLTKITQKGKVVGNSYDDSIDTSNNPTFHVIKGSTTEQTLITAGYLTADNTVYIADTTALETAIADADAIDTSKYTDETVSALAAAVENGKALLENESATQEEVDQAVTAIKDAISALKEKVDEPTTEATTEEPTEEPTTEEPTAEPTVEPETQEPTEEPTEAADVTVSVVPDKAYAKPGDEVTYTVHVDSAFPLYTLQMQLVIPEGLTYVANSGALVEGIQDTLGFDNVGWTEQTLIINGVATAPKDVTSFDLATFKCTVDEGVADGTALELGLTYLEFCKDLHFNPADVISAAVPGVVTVGEDPNPTEEPTDEPTQEPSDGGDATKVPSDGGSTAKPTEKPADNNNSNNGNNGGNNNNSNNGGANGTGTSATDKPVNTGAQTAVGLSAFLAAAAIGLVALKKRNR